MKEVEACIRECLDDVQLPQQLADKVLALLKALEDSGGSRCACRLLSLTRALVVWAAASLPTWRLWCVRLVQDTSHQLHAERGD